MENKDICLINNFIFRVFYPHPNGIVSEGFENPENKLAIIKNPLLVNEEGRARVSIEN